MLDQNRRSSTFAETENEISIFLDRNHLYFHFFLLRFFYQSVTDIFFDFFSLAFFLSSVTEHIFSLNGLEPIRKYPET